MPCGGNGIIQAETTSNRIALFHHRIKVVNQNNIHDTHYRPMNIIQIVLMGFWLFRFGQQAETVTSVAAPSSSQGASEQIISL